MKSNGNQIEIPLKPYLNPYFGILLLLRNPYVPTQKPPCFEDLGLARQTSARVAEAKRNAQVACEFSIEAHHKPWNPLQVKVKKHEKTVLDGGFSIATFDYQKVVASRRGVPNKIYHLHTQTSRFKVERGSLGCLLKKAAVESPFGLAWFLSNHET